MYWILIIIILVLIYLRWKQYPKKYDLCIVSIFKNEELYLEEWIIYHINQGIDHLYLYCNDQNLEKYKYLDKYTNYITLIDWTIKKNDGIDTVQKQAYYHCITNYNNEYKYLALLDIDEFIVPLDKNKKVVDVVNALNNFSELKIPRFNYGNNGHIVKPDGNVMDNYTMRETICSSFKSIANSEYINTNSKFYWVHQFPLVSGGKVYNSYFNYDNGGPSGCNKDSINEIGLIVRHYYTKSKEEFMKRCDMWKNGGINDIGYRKDCVTLFDKMNINEIEDK
jgi:hypothetical protein